MWEGDRLVAKRVSARDAGIAPALQIAGGHALRGAAPVRPDPIALSADVSAHEAFGFVLAHYAAVIAENLRCVLTETDPEGAHQLRVTLRRLRTTLRIFKPAIRRAEAKRMAWVARYVGAIVGELRDADVIVEEMFRPALGLDVAPMRAAEVWREEVRGKVRASLSAARATAFANDLILQSRSGEWRTREKRMRRAGSAGVLLQKALLGLRERAVGYGDDLRLLADIDRHDLRKQMKALRYSAELSIGYDESAATMVGILKRLQGDLGRLNDMHMLASAEPGACREHLALSALRHRLIEEHKQIAPTLLQSATRRWAELSLAKTEPLRR